MSDDLRSKIAKSIYRNLVDGITDSTWEIQDNDFKNRNARRRVQAAQGWLLLLGRVGDVRWHVL